jgi:hypothetical protein
VGGRVRETFVKGWLLTWINARPLYSGCTAESPDDFATTSDRIRAGPRTEVRQSRDKENVPTKHPA